MISPALAESTAACTEVKSALTPGVLFTRQRVWLFAIVAQSRMMIVMIVVCVFIVLVI